MKKHEPLDPNSSTDEKKNLVTIRLLAISLTIYAITLIIFIFQDQFGMARSTLMTTFTIALVIALGLNITGLVKGIFERKINPEMAANGIIGNLIPIVIALICLGLVLYFISEMGEFKLNFRFPKINRT